MRAIRSFQDFTKDAAPSSCSRCGERVDVDARLGEAREHRLAIAAVRRQSIADLAVIGEGLERALRHRVDRERRGERLHIEDVGGLRILGAGAGPEQALRPGAGIGGALPARRSQQLAIGLVGALRDGDAEAVGQLRRHLSGDGDVPAADEHRGDRADRGIEARLDAPLDAAQIGFGRRQILLAREQQRDVDRNAGEDRFLDRRQAFLGAGDFDEQVGLCRRARCRSRAAARVLRRRGRAAARPRARPSRPRRRCA